MEHDFYAPLKFKNVEEVFAKVAASEEEDRTLLIVSHPITVSEIKHKSGGLLGYKVEPWLKTSNEDLFILNMNDVLTLSESSDVEMIHMYQSFVRDTAEEKHGQSKMSRKMGFLGRVDDTKEILEKIFKNNNTHSSSAEP